MTEKLTHLMHIFFRLILHPFNGLFPEQPR